MFDRFGSLIHMLAQNVAIQQQRGVATLKAGYKWVKNMQNITHHIKMVSAVKIVKPEVNLITKRLLGSGAAQFYKKTEIAGPDVQNSLIVYVPVQNSLIVASKPKINDGKKPYFDFSSSDLVEVVQTDAFVDKSMLIKEIFESSKVILITAPRRFGKSSNMYMVKRYVEIQVDNNGAIIEKHVSSNYEIFKNLNIFKETGLFDQHFAAYPVIYVDFKPVAGDTFEKVLYKVKEVLQEAFLQHGYLLKSDKLDGEEKETLQTFCGSVSFKKLTKEEVESGLKFLSRCLYRHFDNKKVFVLIDEYDAPINNTIFKKNIDFDQVNELLCQIYSNTLKNNNYVERALLTGISYFASVGLSGVNNIKKYMFLGEHPFVKYYGLTEPEVEALLKKFEEKFNESHNKEIVKSFYNGYIDKKGHKLYSLWSVLNYLDEKVLKSFWEMSGMMYGMKGALYIPDIRSAVEELLQDNYCKEIKIFDRIQVNHLLELRQISLGPLDTVPCEPDLFLNFLLQQGYLTYKINTETKKNSVAIPNDQMRNEFKEILHDYLKKRYGQNYSKCVESFKNISISDRGSFQTFVENFQVYIREASRNLIRCNEFTFHSYLFGVVSVGDDVKVGNNVEFSGSRLRPDLIVLKGKLGFIIEVKWNQTSEDALKQILDKEYYTIFNNDRFKNVENKLYWGINVSENLDVSLGVLINSTNKDKVWKFQVP